MHCSRYIKTSLILERRRVPCNEKRMQNIDTKDTVTRFYKITVAHITLLVSLDVKSNNTNICHELGLQVVKYMHISMHKS